MRFFVNPDTRMTRTIDPGDSVPGAKWTEVIEKDYDQFRKITKIFFTSSMQKEALMAGNGNELTLKGIKRAATKHKKAQRAAGEEITHTQALEAVAIKAGYQNYTHARKSLGDSDD